MKQEYRKEKQLFKDILTLGIMTSKFLLTGLSLSNSIVQSSVVRSNKAEYNQQFQPLLKKLT